LSSNWLSWIKPSPKEAEQAEMLALLNQLRQQSQWASPFHNEDQIIAFIIDLITEACERHGTLPGVPLGGALYGAIQELMQDEGIIGDLPNESDIRNLNIEEGVRVRAALKRRKRFLDAQDRLLPIWRTKLVWLFKGLIDYFPESAFIDVDENGQADDDSVVFPRAHAFDLCENLPEVIQRIMVTLCDQDVVEAHLFEPCRDIFDSNILRASGLPPEARFERAPRVILPTESRLREPSTLVDAYLQGTPFQELLYRPLPFAIPFPARFEHTHIVGGTGHGKTQLMQFLIHHDIVRAKEDGRSIVVIDSQGDLINTISKLGYFSDSALAERFVLVDPNDIEHPVCLNMFDFNRDRLSGYAPVDREKILNATIELYEYFFGALLGAELTQRQGLIFRYLARLLIEIPDANIHTLRELMEDGTKFRPYMEKLNGTARSFFVTQFFDKKFGETKKQILTRLWGILSNSSLERMFSHTRNKIDIFELLNQGKIILINTAKDLLGQDGAAIFGRFFIALIAQASIQRAAMPPHERRSAFVYIDEAQDYFDENISHLLNQARKYRVGLIFAHQNLDQLSANLRSSVLASTTIKFAGGLSAKDAGILDSEFRTNAEFLLSMQKNKDYTEFACYVKNYTAKALTVSIPLGFVESQPRITASEYAELQERNRELYSEPPMLPEEIAFPTEKKPEYKAPQPAKPKEPTPEQPQPVSTPVEQEKPASHEQQPVSAPSEPERPEAITKTTAPPKRAKPISPEDIPPSGRGGRQHKYLQHLIKQLAEERGFRATIEETILDGAGRVDVSLVREKIRVACQVSVTTTKDWELGGIEKCFAAGYSKVVLVSSTERHIKKLAKFVEENLDPKDQGRVRYVTSDGIIEFLDSLGVFTPTEQVVRGYKVRTVQQATDSEDAASRRKAISEVIARSLQKGKEK
jgi:hypothetical protein